MSSGFAALATASLVATCLALVFACQCVPREPFLTVDRWLADIWNGIYRATGAAALDRRIGRARDHRDAAMFTDMAEALNAAGLDDQAALCRAHAARALTGSLPEGRQG